jgi:hypothetical protein
VSYIGWERVERTIEWRRRYDLEVAGHSRDEIERLMEAEVVDVPPELVAAALVDEVQPSPFGRQPSIFDEA